MITLPIGLVLAVYLVGFVLGFVMGIYCWKLKNEPRDVLKEGE